MASRPGQGIQFTRLRGVAKVAKRTKRIDCCAGIWRLQNALKYAVHAPWHPPPAAVLLLAAQGGLRTARRAGGPVGRHHAQPLVAGGAHHLEGQVVAEQQLDLGLQGRRASWEKLNRLAPAKQECLGTGGRLGANTPAQPACRTAGTASLAVQRQPPLPVPSPDLAPGSLTYPFLPALPATSPLQHPLLLHLSHLPCPPGDDNLLHPQPRLLHCVLQRRLLLLPLGTLRLLPRCGRTAAAACPRTAPAGRCRGLSHKRNAGLRRGIA